MVFFSLLGHIKSKQKTEIQPFPLENLKKSDLVLFQVSSLVKRTGSGKAKLDLVYRNEGVAYKIEAMISGENESLSVGSYIAVKNPSIQSLQRTNNPVAFDYNGYLLKKGYSARLFAKESELLYCQKGSRQFLPFFKRWQIQSEEFILNLPLGNRSRELLPALLLGSKNQMSSEFKESFQTSGVIHLLAVSGLHLGLIYLAFQFLFKPLGLPRWIFQLLTLLPLWIYAGFVGFTVSVVRAAFMFTVLGLAQKYKRSHSLANWMAAAAGLLFMNPGILIDIGFQLSFSAVAGILVLNPIIRKYNRSRFKIIRFIFAAAGISLAAQLSTFPIIYYHFGGFPTYFLPANLLVIPLITAVHYSSSLVILLSTTFILPDWVFKFIETLVELSYQLAHFFSDLPFAVLRLSPLQPTFIFFTLFLAVSVWVSSKLAVAKENPVLLFLFIPLLFVGYTKLNIAKSELCFHQSERGWMVSYNSTDSILLFHSKEARIPTKVEYLLSPLSSEVTVKKQSARVLSLPGGLLEIALGDSLTAIRQTKSRWLLNKDLENDQWNLKEFDKEGQEILSVFLSDTAVVYMY